MAVLTDLPIYPHGYVTGRYLTSIPDIPDDPDRDWNFKPATGKITFTPVAPIRVHTGPVPAYITQESIYCTLDSEGFLQDNNGQRGVYLIEGTYTVKMEIAGSSINSPAKIVVTPEHTPDRPLNLVLAADVPVPPGTVGIVDESTALRAETAAQKAETYAADLPNKVREVLLATPELKGDPGQDSTVPGPPGALSSASTFILVGPGRPDTPATTSGVITGSEPVGAEYRSTDGAGVGAWTWRKRGTGWAVTDGDTGWRNVFFIDTADFLARVAFRRVASGVQVYAEAQSKTATGTYVQPGPPPTGFRFVRPLGPGVRFNGMEIAAPLHQYGGGGNLDQIGHVQVFNGAVVVGAQRKPSPLGGGLLTYDTSDPWPTSLPGTPA